jgi:hypothetical protein
MSSLFAFGSGLFGELNRLKQVEASEAREDEQLKEEHGRALEIVTAKEKAKNASANALRLQNRKDNTNFFFRNITPQIFSQSKDIQELYRAQLMALPDKRMDNLIKAWEAGNLHVDFGDPTNIFLRIGKKDLTIDEQYHRIISKLGNLPEGETLNQFDTFIVGVKQGHFGDNPSEEFEIARKAYAAKYKGSGILGGISPTAPGFFVWFESKDVFRNGKLKWRGWQSIREDSRYRGILRLSKKEAWDNIVSIQELRKNSQQVTTPTLAQAPPPIDPFEVGDVRGSDGSEPNGQFTQVQPKTPTVEQIETAQKQRQIQVGKDAIKLHGKDAYIIDMIKVLDQGGDEERLKAFSEAIGIPWSEVKIARFTQLGKGTIRDRAFNPQEGKTRSGNVFGSKFKLNPFSE